VIVGIVLLFTVGVHGSYLFYGGSKIIVNDGNADIITAVEKMLNDDHIKFTKETYSGVVEYVCHSTISNDQINAFHTLAANDAADIYAVTFSNSGMMSYLNNTLITLLILTGFICVYTMLRLHMLSIIPMFINL
jgi:hypothetical protein